MVSRDSTALAKARADVDKAIAEFVRVSYEEHANEMELSAGERPFLLGWAAEAEYVTTSMELNDQTGSCGLVKEDQPPGYSRGLFEIGTDRYSRINR